MDRLDQEEWIIGSVSLLANRLAQFGDAMLPDITFRQWFLLLLISRMDLTEKSIHRIAEVAGTSRQNVKKLLVPLEKKGYVQIQKSARDARSLQVELTGKAWQYFSDHAKLTAGETERLFAPFQPEEVRQLAELLEKLQKCLEQYEREGKADA